MGLRLRIAMGLVVVWLAQVSLCSGQTNDEFYRSWRFVEDVGPARAAGLGGAFVALADDSSSATLNPAGLTLLPKTELSGGVLWRGAGSLAADATAGRVGAGYIGGGAPLTKKWAVGGYLTQPFDERVALGPGSSAGRLDTTVTDAGGAVGWSPTPRVRLGLRLNLTHVRVEGEWSRGAGATATLRVGAAAGATRLTGDLGLLMQVTDELRVGATYRQGASWDVSRTATNPSAGVAIDPGSVYRYRSPSVASAGASLRAGLKVVVSAQLDYIRLSEVRDVFVVRVGPFSAGDYELKDAVEARGGVEFSQPVGGLSIQVRAGVHGASGASLRYVGTDEAEAIRFRGSSRMTEWSAGASLVLSSGSRLDVALTSDKLRTVASAGAALRF